MTKRRSTSRAEGSLQLVWFEGSDSNFSIRKFRNVQATDWYIIVKIFLYERCHNGFKNLSLTKIIWLNQIKSGHRVLQVLRCFSWRKGLPIVYHFVGWIFSSLTMLKVETYPSNIISYKETSAWVEKIICLSLGPSFFQSLFSQTTNYSRIHEETIGTVFAFRYELYAHSRLRCEMKNSPKDKCPYVFPPDFYGFYWNVTLWDPMYRKVKWCCFDVNLCPQINEFVKRMFWKLQLKIVLSSKDIKISEVT